MFPAGFAGKTAGKILQHMIFTGKPLLALTKNILLKL